MDDGPSPRQIADNRTNSPKRQQINTILFFQFERGKQNIQNYFKIRIIKFRSDIRHDQIDQEQ